MTFQDPVVGETTLLRPAIRSPNYVAGSVGWTINDDGTAEFANVNIYGGSLTIDDGAGHVTEVTSTGSSYTNTVTGSECRVGNSTLGPSLTSRPALETPDGDEIGSAIVGTQLGIGDTANQAATVIHSPTITDEVSSIYMWCETADHTRATRIEFWTAEWSFTGTCQGNLATTGNLIKDAWHAATPQNSWSGNIRYRKISSPPDAVQIYVRCTPGTKSDGTLLFDLPTGYRPTGSSVDVPTSSWTLSGQPPHLAVDTDGHVRIYGMSGTGGLNCDAWFTTDNGGI